MWISGILLRWYKSFNGASADRIDAHPFRDAHWNGAQGVHYVYLPLDRRSSTIVGANEAGKSHLLSGLSKAIRGSVETRDRPDQYANHDICRYSGLDAIDTEPWPHLGIEIDLGDDQAQSGIKELDERPNGVSRVHVLVNGADPNYYARVYFDPKSPPTITLNRDKWIQWTDSLPEVRFIYANAEMSNEIHIDQLLALYSDRQPEPVTHPLMLEKLVKLLKDFKPEPNKPLDPKAIEAYQSLVNQIDNGSVRPRGRGYLEYTLFSKILGIPKKHFEKIREKSISERPYVEYLISAINDRIAEQLDISHYWQQDDEFKLSVDYKGGFLYFEITDKTGFKYSFEERSSGLKYFLSYYIQALAIQRANTERGSLILMDEPDGFLSAAGQRNLLSVFDNLVDPKRSKGACQLVYTTHSPFLINRNHPDRIRLLRKGDGSEGTQFVDLAYARRFEPVRTALGVDFADSLFVGAENVLVEGMADHKLLVSCIQAFELPDVNLNHVTFIAAGGTRRVKPILERSFNIEGDDKRPPVIVLLDGDKDGIAAGEEITTTKVLDDSLVKMVSDVGLKRVDGADVKVLEDLIPMPLLQESAKRYLKSRWNVSITDWSAHSITVDCDAAAWLKNVHRNLTKDHPELKLVDQLEFRSAVVEELSEGLIFDDWARKDPEYGALKDSASAVVAFIREHLDVAVAERSRELSSKRIRYVVRTFKVGVANRMSKASVLDVLRRLSAEVGGSDPLLRSAQERLARWTEELEKSGSRAEDEVDRKEWLARLEAFASNPWKTRN